MKKTIRLTETDLNRLVKRVINEQGGNYFGNKSVSVSYVKKQIENELKDMGYTKLTKVKKHINDLAVKIMDDFYDTVSYMVENNQDEFDEMEEILGGGEDDED